MDPDSRYKKAWIRIQKAHFLFLLVRKKVNIPLKAPEASLFKYVIRKSKLFLPIVKKNQKPNKKVIFCLK